MLEYAQTFFPSAMSPADRFQPIGDRQPEDFKPDKAVAAYPRCSVFSNPATTPEGNPLITGS
jgi:hypothetical protein